MTRPQSILAILVGTLALAAAVYALNFDTPATARVREAPWLPEGLRLRDPEIPRHITGTIREFNQSLSEGLEPEDNAAVLLAQVFGAEVFAPSLREASLAMLGIEALSEHAPRFHYIAPFLSATRQLKGNALDEAAADLEYALVTAVGTVWTRDDFPVLAEYLEFNHAALELIVTASHRPRYYAPLLSMEDPPRLMATSFAIEYRLPFVARCLAARALLRFGAGDDAGAISDLMAAHTLAALLAAGSPLDVSGAKAQVMDSLAATAELTMIRSGQLHAEQAAALLSALQQLPPIPTSELAADRGERAILHQELELLRTDPESRQGFLESGSPEDLKQLERLVKNDRYFRTMLAAADAAQDEVVRVLSMRDRDAQDAELRRLYEEYQQWLRGGADEPSFSELVAADPEAAARSVGETMAMSLRTNVVQRRHTDDRARHRRDIISVGLALLVFRGREGAFPEELSQLAPGILPEVPDDVFARAPFVYRRLAPDHAQLISWGLNQVDDAGQEYNDDWIIELR